MPQSVGRIAVRDFGLVAAFGGKADIELLDDGHKKGQHLPAFSVSIAQAAPLLNESYTRYLN